MVIYLIHNTFSKISKQLYSLLAVLICAIACHAQEVPLWKIHYDSTQQYWGNDWRKCIQHLQTAEHAALSDLGMYDNNYLTIINDLGLAYWQSKDFENAEKMLTKSYRLKHELLNERDPELLRAISNLAGLFTDQSKDAQARQLYKKVLKQYVQVSEDL